LENAVVLYQYSSFAIARFAVHSPIIIQFIHGGTTRTSLPPFADDLIQATLRLFCSGSRSKTFTQQDSIKILRFGHFMRDGAHCQNLVCYNPDPRGNT
jgi:hypothetical protein